MIAPVYTWFNTFSLRLLALCRGDVEKKIRTPDHWLKVSIMIVSNARFRLEATVQHSFWSCQNPAPCMTAASWSSCVRSSRSSCCMYGWSSGSLRTSDNTALALSQRSWDASHRGDSGQKSMLTNSSIGHRACMARGTIHVAMGYGYEAG